MKHLFLFLLAVMTLAGCKDRFDIDSYREDPKTVLYAFPSGTDSTMIRISGSIPPGAETVQPMLSPAALETFIYKVNGAERKADFVESENGKTLVYRVFARLKAGDKVEIQAKLKGMAPVEAHSTVPEQVPVTLTEVKEVERYDTDGYKNRYWQFAARFTDEASTHDYYAVRVLSKNDFSTESMELWTGDEPVLNPMSEVDEALGFENNFYQNFYIFDDADINGKTYTLHLNVDYYRLDRSFHENPMKVAVALYKISPEFYRFLRSLNNASNNSLGEVGLAQMSPMYSNVKGGMGLVGAYSVYLTPYVSVTDF